MVPVRQLPEGVVMLGLLVAGIHLEAPAWHFHLLGNVHESLPALRIRISIVHNGALSTAQGTL